MTNQGDVLRAMYEALRIGDVPGVVARLSPDVTIDEPPALPYGGVSKGSERFVESVLGGMTSNADISITDATVIDNESGVVGILTGTLTARGSGEVFPLTMVEIHEIVGDRSVRMDIYCKDPQALADFYARAAASA